MKDYYSILGLTTYAEAPEIKRAYRNLALLFHPDRNKSPEAAAVFVEINEAYEVLGDPMRKVLYDQMLAGAQPTPPVEPTITKPHRDPRYRPKSSEYIRQVRTRQKPYMDFITKHLNIAMLFSRLALLFAMVLLADYSMKPNKKGQLIARVEKKIGNESVKVAIGDGDVFTLGGKSVSEFAAGAVINLYSSPIFSIPTKIENEQTKFQAVVPITIYGNFIFVPFFLLVTSLVGTFYWKGVEFRFNLGVMNFLLIILNYVFLNIHSL